MESAIQVALTAHAGQLRKACDVPYVSHPIHVASLLARLGCEQEVVQAGLLHDVVEDCDDWSLERLSAQFSERVVGWIRELTEQKGSDWETRKRFAIDHVPKLSPEAAIIKGADKLHNMKSMIAILREAPDRAKVWEHFSRGPEQTVSMSEDLVNALSPRIPAVLAQELQSTVQELRELCG